MYPPSAYRIRYATAVDADALKRLAAHNGRAPLSGRVLIGQLDGTLAAALSLSNGSVITDPSRRTDRVVAALRIRASAIRAYETTPSLGERVRAALAGYHHGGVVAAWPQPKRHTDDDQPDELAA
jgi:hypothetical protein